MRICLESSNAVCKYWQVCRASPLTDDGLCYDSDAATPSGKGVSTSDPPLLTNCGHRDFTCLVCNSVYCGCCYALFFSKNMPQSSTDPDCQEPVCMTCFNTLIKDYGWKTRYWCTCGNERFASVSDLLLQSQTRTRHRCSTCSCRGVDDPSDDNEEGYQQSTSSTSVVSDEDLNSSIDLPVDPCSSP